MSPGGGMTVYVSMLRAVNVGGTSRIKMEALRRVYESLGLADVRTLLHSGNVVFRSSLEDRQALVKRITQEIERQLHLKVDVILRTLAEVATIVERGPVLSPRADSRIRHDVQRSRSRSVVSTLPPPSSIKHPRFGQCSSPNV